MYQKGDLKIQRPCERDGDDYCRLSEWDGDSDHKCWVPDSRADNTSAGQPAGTVYLPHSCDEWVIGGPDEIRALIEDLRLALDERRN